MGNFDAYATPKSEPRQVRSVLRHGIGPNATNAPEDLHIITQTLTRAGLLDKNANPAITHAVIFRAIQHARQTLTSTSSTTAGDVYLTPGDETERAVRRALAGGRLPLSHRAVCNSKSPKGARSVIDSGMRRAREKLNGKSDHHALSSPACRALLPVISVETFQSNRRLADALVTGGHIADLERILAATIAENGKQGFSDIRDFFQILKSRAPGNAHELFERTASHLKGKSLRRFRKLYFGTPPVEGDFTDKASGTNPIS
ncbi:hypothetical protein L2D14_06940 [Thalassospiraceae bacterium LMO-JJ14]|nr:hypothetical protein L2D14_06940 [Thalassospiraceae bacterium LMO-JJ14]